MAMVKHMCNMLAVGPAATGPFLFLLVLSVKLSIKHYYSNFQKKAILKKIFKPSKFLQNMLL